MTDLSRLPAEPENAIRRGSCTAGYGSDSVIKHAAEHLLEVAEESLSACVLALRTAVLRGSRIYTLGNGGSASTASHLACDLARSVPPPGGPWARAHCVFDMATTTATGNDDGYAEIFASPLRALLEEDDVLVAMSVSGRSANVTRALQLGRERGATNIALLGSDGGDALPLADASLHVQCGSFGVVESVHLAMVHELASRLHQPGPAERCL